MQIRNESREQELSWEEVSLLTRPADGDGTDARADT